MGDTPPGPRPSVAPAPLETRCLVVPNGNHVRVGTLETPLVCMSNIAPVQAASRDGTARRALPVEALLRLSLHHHASVSVWDKRCGRSGVRFQPVASSISGFRFTMVWGMRYHRFPHSSFVARHSVAFHWITVGGWSQARTRPHIPLMVLQNVVHLFTTLEQG